VHFFLHIAMYSAAVYHVTRCLSAHLSHATVVLKWLNISSDLFYLKVATLFCSVPNVMAVFRWVPPNAGIKCHHTVISGGSAPIHHDRLRRWRRHQQNIGGSSVATVVHMSSLCYVKPEFCLCQQSTGNSKTVEQECHHIF